MIEARASQVWKHKHKKMQQKSLKIFPQYLIEIKLFTTVYILIYFLHS